MSSNPRHLAEVASLEEKIVAAFNQLSPGERKIDSVSTFDHDTVVILPAYVTDKQLVQAGITEPSLAVTLASMSESDVQCPAVVWIKDGTVAEICKLFIRVPVDLSSAQVGHSGERPSVVLTLSVEQTGGNPSRFVRLALD